MEYTILCIFTPEGKTFTFKDVKIICNNETTLQFSYRAMSDGRFKEATFPKPTLCGWSLTLREGPRASIDTGKAVKL